MPPISGAIIAYNEARNMPRVIRSLGCADEVVVLDSGSTDGTREVAASLGARVIQDVWHGYAAQKNLAVGYAEHDWILSLDADEELDETAQAEIRRWKESSPAAQGYRLARRTRYLGRWILHGGWYPDYKVRLFNRQQARWQGSYVHESVSVSGRVETLRGEILHCTCDTLEEHLERIELYTDLAAAEMIEKGKTANRLERWFTPPWIFFHTYFLRLGILDGHQGYLIARMAARYVTRKYQKVAEKRVALHGRS
jgi:glycosyltransferase involved in cell wall biosynthesis